MADLKEIQINGVVYNFKDTTARTQVGTGTPTIVSLIADMVDTTKPYLYVGSETGYTAGDWYYYDGSAWVSGGTYGTDGGINTNARNILKYILQRVAYTEQGMQTYVDALYQALAQAGGGSSETTTYMIMNALTHVTNSNDATGCDEGDSYSATLTPDTDYTIDSVVITMGGVDVTSTAYDSTTNTITIANVTGDIVITASATDISWDVEWNYTMGLPNDNGFSLTNSEGTISLANNGLSVATADSSSSNVYYEYRNLGLKTEVITELVFTITAFSSQSGSGVRDNGALGGTGSTAKKCAQLCLSQNGIQYLGAASGWSTLSATPLELNTEYTVRLDQTDGNADIYLNGTLVGSITSFREAVGWPKFGVYRGVSALLKSYRLKYID